ncbi:hypothetical protein GLOIN_2v1791933 [Rhizophagus irregularis DAOM 181602=DAOM 197198]|nr:hypothetical protein GLOIN_2v1791933 [Rhizophagus irregularis DAOM 181602=DAOM 197198]
MAIVSHWYDWYGVEVRGWIFLEPGEAKTTVDSHHATIAHAIKRYSNRRIEKNHATLIIKNLKPYLASPNGFVWDWPITEEAAGYVRAKSLPNIGKWTEFSPADINTFCGEINRPNPEYTTPTKPKTPWLTSLLMKKGMQKSLERDETQNSPTPISNQMGVDTEFPLKPGWALKENQKNGLKELAHENELSVEDIPEVKTIKGWIGRYKPASGKKRG